MPLIGTELVLNAEEEKTVRDLLFAWKCYREATHNMRRVAERATKIIFPFTGRSEIKVALTTIDGQRYRLEKDGEITKVQPL